MIRKAIIPAAGRGTRFAPITRAIPKEMLPIWNRPAIEYVIDEAFSLGISEVIIVNAPNKKPIDEYFGRRPGVRIAVQEKPNGLGDAIFRMKHLIGDEPFAVFLPDVILSVPSKRFLKNSGSFGLMLEEVPAEAVSSYGIVALSEGKVSAAVEKPEAQKAPSRMAIVGRYVLPPAIFPELLRCTPGTMGEIQLTDAIDRLCRKTPAAGIMAEGQVFDVGTPAGMNRAWEWAGQAFGYMRKRGRPKGRGDASVQAA